MIRRNLFAIWMVLSAGWAIFQISKGPDQPPASLVLRAVSLPIFLLLMASAVWAIAWLWKRFGEAEWSGLPSNVRKGLLRLYTAVSLPWIVWFGYQTAYYADRSNYSISARQHLSTSILLLLFVPLGVPILLKIVIWIIQGFAPRQKEQTAKNGNHPKTKSSFIQAEIDQLRIKMSEDLSLRPDFLANKYLRTGWLYGKHFSEWQRLDEAKLSAEQKAKLPPSYYEKGGIDLNELGRCFGYPSGDLMIDGLIKLQEGISQSGSLENLVDGLVNEQIIQRLKTKARTN